MFARYYDVAVRSKKQGGDRAADGLTAHGLTGSRHGRVCKLLQPLFRRVGWVVNLHDLHNPHVLHP
jgi:hypothetical protein